MGEVSVLLFTDGNANVAFSKDLGNGPRARRETIERELVTLGSAFQKEKVTLTVIDTQNTFFRTGEASAVAQRLGAQYSLLPVTR